MPRSPAVVRVLLPVLGASLLACPTVAPTFSITGTVTGSAGLGVTVTLAGPVSASATTDATGRFVFSGLADGSYTVVPVRAGFAFSPATRQVKVAGADVAGQDFLATQTPCSGVPAGFPPGDAWARERTTLDQPDDFPGEYQVHVLYVEPGDRGAEPRLDVNGTLRRTVSAFNDWLALRTGGPRLRLDTCDGTLDVTFVKLPATSTERELAEGRLTAPAGPAFIRDRLEAALAPAFGDPKKLYLVYWDGLALARCGGAPWPPALTGQMTVLYVGGIFHATFLTAAATAGQGQLTVYRTQELQLPTAPFPATLGGESVTVSAVTDTTLTLAAGLAAAHPAGEVLQAQTTIPACRANPFSGDGQRLGYWEYAAAHEVMHPLGVVAPTAADFAAPPTAAGHLGPGSQAGVNDLMYQGTEAWGCSVAAASPAASTCQLDPGHRNYFQLPAGSTAVDLARSVFLTPTPMGATPPPGW